LREAEPPAVARPARRVVVAHRLELAPHLARQDGPTRGRKRRPRLAWQVSRLGD
jgi:hypothetical protein